MTQSKKSEMPFADMPAALRVPLLGFVYLMVAALGIGLLLGIIWTVTGKIDNPRPVLDPDIGDCTYTGRGGYDC